MSKNLEAAAKQINIASYEYPGYISIIVGNAQFHFGDANGPIGWDVGPADDPGALRDGSKDGETIPADSSIDAIIAYVREVIETATGKQEKDWHPGSSTPPDEVTTSIPPQVAHMDALFAHPGNAYQWHEKVRSLRQLAIRFETELIGLRQTAAKSEPTSSLDKARDESLNTMRMMKHEARSRMHEISGVPEDPIVKAICDHHGYGAVMDSAARQWQLMDPSGAFVVGPCLGTVESIVATADV